MKRIGLKRRKVVTVLLYLLPILFFVSSYFLMVTSGEDVGQGANTTPNPIANAVNSFKWSARTSDVFQHVIIKFYTYTSFEGSISNFVCRAIDVVLAGVFLYLAMYFVLGRRPKLEIKDALLANVFFVVLIFSAHARVLYRGFSLINNYLFIGIAALLFCVPFIKDISRKHKASWPFAAWMFVGGFLFGISHNVTPLAFLLAYILYYAYLRFAEKEKAVLKQALSRWKVAALAGLTVGVLFCYIIGPGVSGYSAGSYARMYDYVGFSSIIRTPVKSAVKIAGHMVANFDSIMQPLYLPAIICGTFVIYAQKKRHTSYKKWAAAEKRVIVALSLFMISYWLAMFQIRDLTRLYFPANITGIIIILYVFNHYFDSFKYAKIGKKLAIISVLVLAFMSTFAVAYRIYIAIDYYRHIEPQLANIRTSSKSELCVSEKDNREKTYPFKYFTQEPIFEDWVMPVKMYDKTITFCEE